MSSEQNQEEKIHNLLKDGQDGLLFALESVKMGTWDIDLENNSINCSHTMLDLWGIKYEDFKGERHLLQSKVHPEDVENMRSQIDAAITNQSIYELEYRIFVDGSIKWIKSRGRCTLHPETKMPIRLSGVVFDITDRKHKEEALELALKAKNDFFNVAGHELKTPLTCLQLQIQVREWDLKNKFPDAFQKDNIQSELNKFKEQLLKLTNIVENILTLTGHSEANCLIVPQRVELNQLVSEVVSSFGIEFSTTLSPTQLECKCDRAKMTQVIQNLLSNAVRYGDRNSIHVGLSKHNQEAHITIQDNGREAPVDPAIAGLGLGLDVSRKIIQSHGGEIREKKKPGQGSEFTIVLPLEVSS